MNKYILISDFELSAALTGFYLVGPLLFLRFEQCEGAQQDQLNDGFFKKKKKTFILSNIVFSEGSGSSCSPWPCSAPVFACWKFGKFTSRVSPRQRYWRRPILTLTHRSRPWPFANRAECTTPRSEACKHHHSGTGTLWKRWNRYHTGTFTFNLFLKPKPEPEPILSSIGFQLFSGFFCVPSRNVIGKKRQIFSSVRLGFFQETFLGIFQKLWWMW